MGEDVTDPEGCAPGVAPWESGRGSARKVYYEQRIHAHRQARNHVHSLERLGYTVTIQAINPGTGEHHVAAG